MLLTIFRYCVVIYRFYDGFVAFFVYVMGLQDAVAAAETSADGERFCLFLRLGVDEDGFGCFCFVIHFFQRKKIRGNVIWGIPYEREEENYS